RPRSRSRRARRRRRHRASTTIRSSPAASRDRRPADLGPSATVSDLEALLALQERDLALDRLHHRRHTLPENTALREAERAVASAEADLARVRSARDEVAREERKLDDEAQGLGTRAAEEERRLYSGEVASPRDLQALQADVEQLRRHQRAVEDRQ